MSEQRILKQVILQLLALMAAANGAGSLDFQGSLADFCEAASSEQSTISARVPLTKEIVLVATPEGTLDPRAVLEPLAHLFEAEWVRDSAGRLHLTLGDPELRGQIEDARAERASRIADWLEKLGPRVKEASGEDEALRVILAQLREWRSRAAAGSLMAKGQLTVVPRGPLDTLIGRLLLAMGAEKLASIQPGSTATYCNQPVGLQVALPKGSQEAISETVRTINKLCGALSAEDRPTGPFTTVWAPLFDSLKPISGPVRVLLTRVPGYSTALYRLRMYDEDGACIGAVVADMDLPSRTADLGSEAALLEQLPERVPLDDDSADFLRLFEAGAKKLSDPRAPALDDPGVLLGEKFEPLTVGMGEAILALAKSSGRTVLANLPDECLGPALAACSKNSLNPKTLFTKLLVDGVVTFEITPEQILIRPSRPVETRTMRVVRTALRNFAKQIVADSGSRVRTEVEFCFHGGPGSCYGEVQKAWRQALLPFGLESTYAPVRYSLGALLGSLGERTLDNLRAGEPLPLSKIPEFGKAMFRLWLESGPPDRPIYSLEPSTAFPYPGLDCRLEIRSAFDPKIRCTTPGDGEIGWFPPRSMRMSDLAEQLKTYKLTPDKVASAFTGRYEIVPSDSLTAMARLGPVLWSQERLATDPTGARLSNVTYSQWPEAVRARFDELLNEMMGGGTWSAPRPAQ